MMGRTHALSGVAAFLAAAPAVDHLGALTAPQIATGAALAAGAAVTPDLDHGDASAARTYGPATRLLATVVGWISGGHRNGTHSILGTAAVTGLAAAVTLNRVATAAALCLLVGFALKALTPASWALRAAAGAAAAASAWWVADLAAGPVLPAAVAVGWLAHIAGDVLTKPGCPLLWPLSQANTSVPLVDTDGPSEKWVVAPLVTVATIGLAATTFAPSLL